jgi:hypothetical protein
MRWNRLSGQGCLGYHLLIADYVASVVNSNSDNGYDGVVDRLDHSKQMRRDGHSAAQRINASR